VKAAGMKMITFHLPFRVSLVTVTNLPLWKASFLNGWMKVLIRDMDVPCEVNAGGKSPFYGPDEV
jgi:hypothetical protein